jgi:hypothetical protein
MSEEIIIKDYPTTSRDNPFDLGSKKIVGGKKPEPLTKVYTAEDQERLLENFIEVPIHDLNMVKGGAFIRYRLKSGEFRLGGYVSANPIAIHDKQTDMPADFIKLYIGNSKSKNYKTWFVKHNDIAHIYIQQSLPAILANRMIKESINKLNNNIKKLNDRLERIERRLSRG